MSHHGRRLLTGIATSVTLAATVFAGLVATAGPAAADSQICLPGILGLPPVCVPSLPINLPGGGLGTGFSTASPTTFANTDTADVVTITDPAAMIYSLLGGANVQIVGPGSATTDVINGSDTTIDTTAGTITSTLDLDDVEGLPADPGAYLMTISPVDTPGSPLPLDSVAVTVTADAPTPTAALTVQPGQTAAATVGTSATPFAGGDVVSFTDATDAVVTGLTLASPSVTATSITGTLTADSSVATGTYNLLVTDTDGQVGTCTGCVVVDNGPGPVSNLTATVTTSSGTTLTWTPPTTGPAVTGYTVDVSKLSPATKVDAGITVTQTGTTPSATVTGLEGGTKYFVSVAATSAGGPGAGASTSFLTPYASTLTLVANPGSTTVGNSITLSGQLETIVGSTHTPLASTSVAIYYKNGDAAKASKLTTVTTDASGDYTHTFSPTRSAAYVAYYPGAAGTATTPGNSSAFSNAGSATVAPIVTLTGKISRHGKTFKLRLRGTVTPNEHGHKIHIYRFIKGVPHKFGVVRLTGHSTYKFVAKGLPGGTYHLQARIGPHAGNLRAKSDKLTAKT
jgi:hypothetical protein